MRFMTALILSSTLLLTGCSDEQWEQVKRAVGAAGQALVDTVREALRSTDGNELVEHCCYQGPYALAHLEDVRFVTADGPVQITEVLPGLSKQDTVAGLELAFHELDLGLVDNDAMQSALKRYDANDNGHLEEPEIVVMYLLELARGLDKGVTGLASGGAPIEALRVSAFERSGIAEYVQSVKGKLNKESKTFFERLSWIRPLDDAVMRQN